MNTEPKRNKISKGVEPSKNARRKRSSEIVFRGNYVKLEWKLISRCVRPFSRFSASLPMDGRNIWAVLPFCKDTHKNVYFPCMYACLFFFCAFLSCQPAGNVRKIGKTEKGFIRERVPINNYYIFLRSISIIRVHPDCSSAGSFVESNQSDDFRKIKIIHIKKGLLFDYMRNTTYFDVLQKLFEII